nr:MAG TPA: hypothetical protein [Caudoviricetes sp.]
MGEPKYDEDLVNLGYLNKVINNENQDKDTTISKNYASQPKPPYYAGDTWTNGNIVYTCVNTRLVGMFVASDWVSESGAKEEAERKNKIFLTQPTDYLPGDMWILQTDDDHRSGKKGEILISTAGRKEYDSDDWINMLGYGTIASINEVAGNLNNAISRIGNVEEAIEDGIIITFYQDTVPEAKHIGDLWYVTGENESYIQGKLYRYDGNEWKLLDDPKITEAFEKANEARIVADGKIQSFYSDTEPTQDMGVGDLWIDTINNNKLYRYNGTNWVAVYDTRVDELVEDVDTVTQRVVEISTDLGKITQRVTETETSTKTVEDKLAQQEISVNGIKSEVSSTNAKIEALSNNKVNSDEYNQTIETLKTMIEQGDSQIEFNFKNIQDKTDELGNIIANNQSVLEEYIRFKGALIELGRVGNDFSAILSNTELAFLQNGQKIAYISNNKLYITDAEVQNKLVIGKFAFIPRANGNLSFTWIGG